jgi:hypothetical protein
MTIILRRSILLVLFQVGSSPRMGREGRATGTGSAMVDIWDSMERIAIHVIVTKSAD